MQLVSILLFDVGVVEKTVDKCQFVFTIKLLKKPYSFV